MRFHTCQRLLHVVFLFTIIILVVMIAVW